MGLVWLHVMKKQNEIEKQKGIRHEQLPRNIAFSICFCFVLFWTLTSAKYILALEGLR